MKSPWITMRTAAEMFDFRDADRNYSPRGAREWIDAHGIPTKKRGHDVIVRWFDVEAAFGERKPKRK